METTIHILAGATASGKTDLALAWAKKHNAAILSCDALCVYRGMDIGTAKPDSASRELVPHYGIDLVPVCEVFSVGAFVNYARTVVDTVSSQGKSLLVTGGSGFYLKAFFQPVTDTIEIPDSIRAEVDGIAAESGLPGLLVALDQLNPNGTPGLDRRNPRRVANALLRCRASGQEWEALHEQFKQLNSPFAAHKKQACVIVRSPTEMQCRIQARTRAMIESGLEDEVRRLMGEGLEDNPSAASAIGYRETIALIQGKVTRAEWETAIELHTRQLARKQERWIRSQIPIHYEYRPQFGTMGDPDDLFRTC